MPSLLFCTIFLVVTVGRGCCFGAPLENPFPLGTVGCLFTRQLCTKEEECVDDLLFGNCQKENSLKDYYRYQLNSKSLEALEAKTWSLIKQGYSWGDLYTQCVLQNALYAFRHHQSPRYTVCHEAGITEDVNKEISSVLEQLFEQYYNAYQPRDSISNRNLGFPSKRDEIVYVHKYFDKSPKPYTKKNYLSELKNSNYLGADDSLLYDGTPDSRISLEDIQKLQNYFRDLDNFRNEEPDIAPEGNFNSKSLNYEKQPLEDKSDVTDEENEESEESLFKDLPENYADILRGLISGEIEPDSLTDEQLNFLASYVNSRLKEFRVIGKDDISENQDESPGNTDFVQKSSGDAAALTSAMESAMDADIKSKEGKGQSQKGDSQPKTAETGNSQSEITEDERTKKVLGIPVVASPLKKSVDMEEPTDTNTAEPVRLDYMFMKVSHPLDSTDINQLLRALANVTGVPFGFSDIRERDNIITWKVDPDLTNGKDAQQISKEAQSKKDKILAESGVSDVEITDIDLGNGLQDELSVKDDRYFVLTFVLCGCIAGILLAVVVIYLIRRHSRSKEKLAQLSTVTEGTEASKDYQDLCRQRMQSKSSEKPEPLHAASRIGSVSESQVRSPSSRSSTSSWSEEPVASNMDISTGHIVLSYMEDHLKNKDRLDREWEALCSYEADPASTNIATDPSNSRKNRYSDILPYDHSRVVLSNASNITSSDYVNASSITDHDPRNPAYIATQGPLPHTVADFWQMVWEQGSVVIVMLTKLTENGEAMCHRYWPEEGSDLYHIYEVHLVSEHIWCDDYLVRSFYLKNLQTNETRTVTQFHFLTWADLGVPSSSKALLDFRRKVNKSYRGRSCPVVVHCSDGCGRTGTYCLIDMVLNRMAKGAKEIDIAATLEHIRDQRMNMVKTKEQFQFALAAVAEEVHAILKALPQ